MESAVSRWRLSLSQFWRLSVLELAVYIEGDAEALRHAQRMLFTQSWKTAAWMRAKRMPSLKEALRSIGRKFTKADSNRARDVHEEAVKVWQRDRLRASR